MQLYRITGTCTICNEFQKTEGLANEPDALMIHSQEHMEEHGHFFEGETIVSTYEDKKTPGEKTGGWKRRSARRR